MIELALVFLKIGLVSFGGGWTIVGIIRNEMLSRSWLTADEFSELVAIAQSTPGPVALNAATMVGFKLQGVLGAIVATLSVITVPVILVIIVCVLSSKLSNKKNTRLMEALKTSTIGLIIMTAWSFSSQAFSSVWNGLCALLAFALLSFTKISPIWVIFGAGILGIIKGFFPDIH